MSDRYVHTVWCDDLRQELGNKALFIGVYVGGVMQVSQLPIVLPKLGMHTWICSPLERPFSQFEMKIVRDDGFVLAQMRPTTVGHAREEVTEFDDATTQVAAVGLAFGSVELPVGCRFLRVVATVDGEIHEGSKLRIVVDKEGVARAFGASVSDQDAQDAPWGTATRGTSP